MGQPSHTCYVTFYPSGQRIMVRRGSSLLKSVLKAQLPIGYSCRGLGVCHACALWVKGDLSLVSSAERALLTQITAVQSRGDFNLRISCLAKIEGDLAVHADYWGPMVRP